MGIFAIDVVVVIPRDSLGLQFSASCQLLTAIALVHSLLDKYDYKSELADIFGKSGIIWLKTLISTG